MHSPSSPCSHIILLATSVLLGLHSLLEAEEVALVVKSVAPFGLVLGPSGGKGVNQRFVCGLLAGKPTVVAMREQSAMAKPYTYFTEASGKVTLPFVAPLETAKCGFSPLPSDLKILGYFAEISIPWKEIGFNAASMPSKNGPSDKGGLMAFSGPGLACDWVEIEGPLHEVWPSAAHRLLFGELPLVEWNAAAQPGVRPPRRKSVRQEVAQSRNQPDKSAGVWTVKSAAPLVDADRLLANFSPRASRRLVAEEVRRKYVAGVESRLKAGDCFESAMRWTYRTALCSSDFLFHLSGNPDDHALASRLSYFLWNSKPDARLTELAATG